MKKKKEEEEVNRVTFRILIKVLGVEEIFVVQDKNPQRLSFQPWKGSSWNRWGSLTSSCLISIILSVFPFILYFFNLFINHFIGCNDKHVIDLANEVRRILAEEHWMHLCVIYLFMLISMLLSTTFWDIEVYLNPLETSSLPKNVMLEDNNWL